MITGLTLGKYAPLHLGHESIFQRAIKEVDHFIVVIYDSPSVIDVPLPVRAHWLRALYPTVEVIEAWNGPEACGDTPEIKRAHEDYLLGLLKSRKIDRFYTAEFYGEHISKALGAQDCRIVKKLGSQVPISGTQIRKDPFNHRNSVNKIVYRDLITNVVFLGAPSTGKTTVAQKMAQEFNTVWMPEYGREYWEKNNVDRRLKMDQLYEIAVEHEIREEALLGKANKYLFTDTNALTTRIFSQYYFPDWDEENWLDDMADKMSSRYDLVFLCDTDIPYDNTSDRSGEGNRIEFQKRIIADLNTRRIPYITLSGNIKERAQKVKSILKRFKKYKLADQFIT